MRRRFIGVAFLTLVLSACGGKGGIYPSSKDYTVRWENWDGQLLEIDYKVPEGSYPHYNSQAPYREGGEDFTYVWAGWEPAVTNVYSDSTYTAYFVKEDIVDHYTVTFDTNGGSYISPVFVKPGERLLKPADPTKIGYEFSGWYSDSSLNEKYNFSLRVSSDFTLYAKWTDLGFEIDRLESPKPYFDYDRMVFAWDEVLNATKYYCTLEKSGIEYSSGFTNNCYYDFYSYSDREAGKYTFKVKAIGDGNKYLSSDYAQIFYEHNTLSLIEIIGFNEYINVLFWNDVDNATSYELIIDNLTIVNTVSTEYDFTGLYAGEHTVKITALKDGWISSSKSFSFTIRKLTTPINLKASFNDSTSEYVVTWDKVVMGNGFVDSYLVNLDNTKVITTDTNVFKIKQNSTYFKNERLLISVVAFDSKCDYLASSKSEDIYLGLNNLLVSSQDSSKGTTQILSGSGYSCETIIISAAPNDNYVFAGWYIDNYLISNDCVYSFTMPLNDYQIEAHFVTMEQAQLFGIVPKISDDTSTISYGMYPQTNVNDQDLITKLNNLSEVTPCGWYLYNNQYYTKYIATPQSEYHFKNGDLIKEGKTYWFKCEPILWNILNANNNEYYVTSSLILSAQCFCSLETTRIIDGKTIYPNNYEFSDVRSWLNTEFYDNAFTFGDDYVKTTLVDNSPETTGRLVNEYACNDTEDRVFLPSFTDIINSDIDFINTDYALATGLESSNYCFYWSRSPSPEGPNAAYAYGSYMHFTNRWYHSGTYAKEFGVHPAITIKMS